MKKNIKKFKDAVIKDSKFIRSMSIVVIVVVTVFGGLLLNCYIPSESMSPTLETGQRCIANRVAYITEAPQRGDIIVFKAPDKEPRKYIKRIIGLPGETVTVVNGKVNIDGSELDEPYVAEEMIGNFGPYYVPKKGDKVELKEVRYDINDNLSQALCYINGNYVGATGTFNQTDSDEEITLDFLKKYCKEVNGEYYIKEDTYFMMGDNRNGSLDSRYWNYQYVKKSKIIAKYMFTYL